MAAVKEKEAGWIFEPTPTHRCILPTKRDLDRRVVGSIWKCGTCGTEYEVGYHGDTRTKFMMEAS